MLGTSNRVAMFTAESGTMRRYLATAARVLAVSALLVSAQDNAADVGSWSDVMEVPLVPVAGAAMPDGRVLMWSAKQPDDFGGGGGETVTSIFDPGTGQATERVVSETGHDMFCPGITMTRQGLVVVTGGQNAEKVSIFNPVTEVWETSPNMQIPRGYQSSVLLRNGQVFVLGGSWSGNDNEGQNWGPRGGEVTTTQGGEFVWNELENIPSSVILTDDKAGPYRADNHLWLFHWYNLVFHAGPSKTMHWIDPSLPSGDIFEAGERPGPDAMCGSFVMYDAGKILTAGGSTSYNNADAVDDASLITLLGDSTEIETKTLPSMKQARAFASTTVLPDGKVLITGGMSFAKIFTDDTAILEPELWDPETEEFTLMAPMEVPRTYHSIGILLKDARVLTGGGGLCGNCGVNHLDVEIYSPPYLFTPSGDLAMRPNIALNKATVRTARFFRLFSDKPAARIAMVRLSSATHAVNTDQRRIQLCGPGSASCDQFKRSRCTTRHREFLGVGGEDPCHSYRLNVRGSAITTRGYWWVFSIDEDGVPSVGETIRVR